MYSITSKLNSTFGTIGNATADKMTAKVGEAVGKNSSFRFSVKNQEHADMQRSTSAKILNIFLLLHRFLYENLLLLNFLLHLFSFGSMY